MTTTKDKLTFHPIADEYPLMSEVDLISLGEDIKANGQRLPILKWKNQILDGRNRYLACQQQGITPRFEDYKGKESDIKATVESLNEHRRHLPGEWLQRKRQARIERVTEARKRGESLQAIADKEGVSKVQVQRDIEEAKSTVPGGTVEPPDGKVKGKDDKVRSATGTPRKKATPTNEPAAINGTPNPPELTQAEAQAAGEALIAKAKADREAAEKATEKDGAELPIPAELSEVFTEAMRFDECERLLKAAQKMMNELAMSKAGYHLKTELDCKGRDRAVYSSRDIANAISVLHHTRPFVCACPYCLDLPKKTCKCCRGQGWTTQHFWKEADASMKEAAAVMRKEVTRA